MRSGKDIHSVKKNGPAIANEINELKYNNAFVQYFLQYSREVDLWVDFETEIKRITSAIYKALNSFKPDYSNEFNVRETIFKKYELMCLHCFDFIREYPRSNGEVYTFDSQIFQEIYGVNWKNVKRRLHSELDGLKRALVIYLKYYMPVVSGEKNTIEQIAEINPDEILTFNYTDTYRWYEFNLEKVIHLHGDINTEKIVLGYNDDDEDDLTLIDFKKYFQRIENQHEVLTDKFFMHNENGRPVKQKDVYLYGLSLDKTDEDLLKIIYEGSKLFHVFYLNDDYDYASKVTNLIAILGKDEFLNGYQTRRIVFHKIVK